RIANFRSLVYDQINYVFIPFTSLKGISTPFMLQSVQQSPVDSPINFKIGSTHTSGLIYQIILMESWICIRWVNITIRIYPSLIKIGCNGGTIGSISTREFRKRIKIPRHGEVGHTVMPAQIFALVDGKDQFLIGMVLIIEYFKIFRGKGMLPGIDHIVGILDNRIHIGSSEIRGSIGIPIHGRIQMN